MLGWLRGLRAAPEIPEAAWQATLVRYRFLGDRPTVDVAQLRTLAALFLRDKEFHGAHGFVISDEVVLAIAAQAVLPLLHLKGGLAWYDDFVGIVVHPAEVVAHRPRVCCTWGASSDPTLAVEGHHSERWIWLLRCTC